MFKKILKQFRCLETLEEKSFWTIGPVVLVIGFLSLFTTPDIMGLSVVRLSACLMVICPLAIMIMCIKLKNYHISYPLMCMITNMILIPMCFIINGGFYSGMPIFCAVTTILCSFCYVKKWRRISFYSSFVVNLATFYAVKSGFQTIEHASISWAQNDIIFSYVVVSLGLFLILNVILDESRIFERGSGLLSTYVDARVKNRLIQENTLGNINAEGEKAKVTVMFADISRFTSTTENMDPVVAADYLNTFLQIADDCVHENEGVVDKFIGDCIMAYWVDTNRDGYGIIPAVKSIIAMREKLYSMSQEIHDRFGFEMDFSAGMEYGDVVIGDIGSSQRKDYTIIGDAVNTASRIQGIASRGELLVSGNIVEMAGKELKLEPMEESHYLRGKNKPMELYRVEGIIDDAETAETGLPIFRNSKSVQNEKINDEHRVFYVCGCRGSFPVAGIRYSEFGGETSCYLLKCDKYAVIIDCGSGLSNAKSIIADCTQVDILITHVHYDHIMGLLDSAVLPKDAKIRVFGHFGGWAGKNTIDDFMDAPYWPVNMPENEKVDIIVGKEYELENNVKTTFYRSDHPNNGTIIKLMVEDQKICIFSDLENPDYIDPEVAKNADLLFFDGMFDDNDGINHKGWGHGTWQKGVSYAMEESVKRLVITHHDPKCGDNELKKKEAEAKKMLPETVFARTGDMYML